VFVVDSGGEELERILDLKGLVIALSTLGNGIPDLKDASYIGIGDAEDLSEDPSIAICARGMPDLNRLKMSSGLSCVFKSFRTASMLRNSLRTCTSSACNTSFVCLRCGS
jgi:hypothetical protein